MNTVSIIIPVYNERNTLNLILKSVHGQKLPNGFTKEIIVVDDGSTDGSKDILNTWKKKCRVIIEKENRGKGYAVRKGIRLAKGEIILIQDSDLEYSPSDYPVLLNPFRNPDVSVVYGSRFLGPHLSTMYLYAMGNKFVTFVSNILFNSNITDMETGFKAFRKKIVDDMHLSAQRFEFEPEITAKILKKGYQIYEVPISYFGRKFTEGKKLTWKDGVTAFFTLLRYRFFD